jgi:hypothetical protein
MQSSIGVNINNYSIVNIHHYIKTLVTPTKYTNVQSMFPFYYLAATCFSIDEIFMELSSEIIQRIHRLQNCAFVVI